MGDGSRSWATAVVYVDTSPDHFGAVVQTLLDRTDLDVVVGVLYPVFATEFREFETTDGTRARVTVRTVGSMCQLVNETFRQRRTHLIVVNDIVVLPPEPFAVAEKWLDDDVRYATVSFLSNAADFLSFPTRNQPGTRAPDGHDEITVTRALRSLSPIATPAPVMFAPGPVVVLAAPALSAVGDLVAPASARFDVAVADFCARARAKGFIDVVDTATFLARPGDISVRPLNDAMTPDDRGWLLHRHQSLIHFLDHERTATTTPFSHAFDLARSKVLGLRILVDGSCFGPHEVGTQVATQHTIAALAGHADVHSVVVSLPGPVPGYAAQWLSGPKVSTIANHQLVQRFGVEASSGGSRSGRSTSHAIDHPFDIAFRPYQPTPGWDIDLWRQCGRRLVISVLDTIAFHNGGYFASSADWLAYREHLLASVATADAVTVISDDVKPQMRLHGFPIADTRLHSITLGTEHLDPFGPKRFPSELSSRGFQTGAFALCLGVNYTHKNREIARVAHERVRSDGHDIALVMAGASVPNGSTRLAETRLGVRDHVFVLPELAADEKNWLLEHATFVWYPTSAEGFGLVPFEAAQFDTPTVAVDFGPLHELLVGDEANRSAVAENYGADVPVLAQSWSPEALADVAIRFLRDPDLAQRHTKAIRHAGRGYSWARTANSFVELFRELLVLPRRAA